MTSRFWGTLRNVSWALFFAGVVWLSVAEETTLRIPDVGVRLVVEHDPDLAVRLPPDLGDPPTVQVSISGPQAKVNQVPFGDLRATIRVPEGEVGRMTFPISPGDIQLPSEELHIDQIVPSQVVIEVQEVARAMVRVNRPEVSHAPALRVEPADVVVQRQEVEVRGPRSVLESLTAEGEEGGLDLAPIEIEPWLGEGTHTFEVRLELPEGVTSPDETVPVAITVRQALERAEVTVPIRFVVPDPGRFPYQIEPAPGQAREIAVQLEGPPDRMEDVRTDPTGQGIHALVFLDLNAEPFNRLLPEDVPVEPGEEVPYDLEVHLVTPPRVEAVDPPGDVKVDILRRRPPEEEEG